MYRLKLEAYENFKKLKFDNFLGEMINPELVKDLWGINSEFKKPQRFLTFKKDHNLSYLGEVLERYEERGIVKTGKDLRAILTFTEYSLDNETPSMNTNQLEMFVQKVEKESLAKKDIFSIGVILQSYNFKKHILNDKQLCLMVIDEVENNENLSFEEKVWAICSCWNFLNSIKEFSSSETLLDMFSDVTEVKYKLLKAVTGIRVESVKYLDDYYLYLMLIKTIEAEEFLQTSKNFKSKEVCNQYKKLVSLAKKEYKDETIVPLAQCLNMSVEDAYFYNYQLQRHAYLCDIDTKVTSKGEMRLLHKLANRLALDVVCPQIVVDSIERKIIEISRETDSSKSSRYYKPVKGRQKACEIFFESFTGKVSVKNFDIFSKILDLSIEYYNFIVSPRYEYLLTSEYLVCFEKLCNRLKKSLAFECLKRCENLEVIKNSYAYIVENDYEYLIDEYQYKSLYHSKIIDANCNSTYKIMKKLHGYLLYLKEVSSKEDYLKELKSLYENLDNIESDVNGYIGKNDYVYRYTNVFLEIVSDMRILKSLKDENVELARQYQAFEDELCLVYYDRYRYLSRIVSLLENKDYTELMELNDEEISSILRAIYLSLQKIDKNDRVYSCVRLMSELECKILTKEELEAKEAKKELDRLTENFSIYSIDSALNKEFIIKDRENILKLKELFLNLVLNANSYSDRSFIRYVFKTARRFKELSVLSDEDMSKITENCLMYA